MKPDVEIVVVGAGIAGLTTAALVAQGAARDRCRLTVLDANARPEQPASADIDLRVSAIAAGSVELLTELGAWARLDASRMAAYEAMRVWDESSAADSGDALRFDAAEFAVPELGFITENRALRLALLDVLREQQVELVFNTALDAIGSQAGRQHVQLADGRKLTADLIIAADGSNSPARTAAGIETRAWQYQQTAFVTHLQPEIPHGNTAWQRFLRSGPLGMLPLADGRISIVWSTSDAEAQWAMTADDAELGDALGAATDYVLGKLAPAGPRGAFSLQAQHAQNYVKAGIALVGDAAHAVHPLAGQGANLGLQDAACLAAVLAEALESGEYPADRPVLRRYERARKGANATMMHFMTGLNRLFATDSPVLKELLTTGMRVFNQSGPIRQHVVGVALGRR